MKILSGIQPTGLIHIGNYLGAIKQWVELQEKNDCLFFISDLHALTIPYKPKELQKNILEVATAHLSVGINPEKSVFFVQSRIKEHTELCWLLNTVCPIGDLERMTQYKEKAKKFKNNENAGLFNYPVLMAADILLYKTEAVPVGKDQIQHVELARTIARRFNAKFGKTFVEPKSLLPFAGEKIMSLSNPRNKMSKSSGPSNYISLFEKPTEIKKKIMSAVTDTGKEIKYDLERKPGISNLLTIYSLFSKEKIKEIEKRFSDKGYAHFKESLSETLIKSLEPFRHKKKEFASRQTYVEETLKKGAIKAENIAKYSMQEIRKKMGLV